MEKRILEEINRVREIMGLKLISEAVGPKPRTVGGLLLNALMGEIKGLKPKEVEKKIALEYANIGKAKTTKEAKDAAQRIKNWADEVRADRTDISKFEDVVGEYFTAAEKNALVRNIGRNSDEVLDNYITATVMFDDKAYNEFVDMVGKGETLADNSVKDYIVRLARANPNLYDVPTLERMWTDIESGQFKYADEAGISVPGRKTKPEEPGFKVDAEGIKDTEGPNFNLRNTDIPEEFQNDIVSNLLEQEAKPTSELEFKINYETNPVYKSLKKVYPGLTEEYAKKITDEIIARLLNLSKQVLPKENESLIKMANDAWTSPTMPVTKKDELIETAVNKVNPRYSPFSKQGIKNYLMARDISTGKNPAWYIRWRKFVIMNLIGITATQLGKLIFQNKYTDWNDFPGDNDAEKIAYILGGSDSIIKAILPWHSGLLITNLIDANINIINPDLERLHKYLGPKGVNWYSGEGDVTKTTPADENYKNYAQVNLKTPDKDGDTDLGVFGFDTDENKLVQFVTGSGGKYTYNPTVSTTPTKTGKYENTLDSLKQWLKDKGKTKYTPTGPDSNGMYKYGESDTNYVEYKFVDPNTGFKIQ